MIRTLSLLLPVIVPSWRFFPAVAPSPRIEIAQLCSVDETPRNWVEFRPRPDALSPINALTRLVWNPTWNETLFLVSCADRFIHDGFHAGLGQIVTHLRADLNRMNPSGPISHFQMRLIVVSRNQNRIVREEVFRSPVHALSDGDPGP